MKYWMDAAFVGDKERQSTLPHNLFTFAFVKNEI